MLSGSSRAAASASTAHRSVAASGAAATNNPRIVGFTTDTQRAVRDREG